MSLRSPLPPADQPLPVSGWRCAVQMLGGELGYLREFGLGLGRARVEQFLEVVRECQESGDARDAAEWPCGVGAFVQE